MWPLRTSCELRAPSRSSCAVRAPLRTLRTNFARTFCALANFVRRLANFARELCARTLRTNFALLRTSRATFELLRTSRCLANFPLHCCELRAAANFASPRTSHCRELGPQTLHCREPRPAALSHELRTLCKFRRLRIARQLCINDIVMCIMATVLLLSMALIGKNWFRKVTCSGNQAVLESHVFRKSSNSGKSCVPEVKQFWKVTCSGLEDGCPFLETSAWRRRVPASNVQYCHRQRLGRLRAGRSIISS